MRRCSWGMRVTSYELTWTSAGFSLSSSSEEEEREKSGPRWDAIASGGQQGEKSTKHTKHTKGGDESFESECFCSNDLLFRVFRVFRGHSSRPSFSIALKPSCSASPIILLAYSQGLCFPPNP